MQNYDSNTTMHERDLLPPRNDLCKYFFVSLDSTDRKRIKVIHKSRRIY